MHATEKNNVCIGFCGLITKSERIADKVGRFLDLSHLIIMRKNNGVAFAFQFCDIRRQINPVVYACAYHYLISDISMRTQTDVITRWVEDAVQSRCEYH